MKGSLSGIKIVYVFSSTVQFPSIPDEEDNEINKKCIAVGFGKADLSPPDTPLPTQMFAYKMLHEV